MTINHCKYCKGILQILIFEFLKSRISKFINLNIHHCNDPAVIRFCCYKDSAVLKVLLL